MEWEQVIILSSNFEVQVKGKELVLISKCGPMIDGFHPHAILMRLDSKENTAEQITNKFGQAACCCLWHG